MSNFRTSQINSRQSGQSGEYKPIRDNELVVVVTKIQGLRNVLKWDKQSPYVSVRIQNQEQSTKVIPRGGQTPYFDQALGFSLEGVEEKLLHINVYHQWKNDTVLICSTEVDYSTALQKSSTDGYDDKFDLFWEGRLAGKIFLQITYHPRKGEVPVSTENIGRSIGSIPNHHHREYNPLRSSRNVKLIDSTSEIPQLGSLNLNDSTAMLPESFAKLTLLKSTNSPSSSPTKSNHRFSDSISRSLSPAKSNESKTTISSSSPSPNNNSNSTFNTHWFSKLDKIPFFNFGSGSSLIGNDKFGFNDDVNDYKPKLKIESPDILQQSSDVLFHSDSEIDDDNDNDGNDNEKVDDGLEDYKKSIASRQELLFNENIPAKLEDEELSSDDDDDEDNDDTVESDEEYIYGQAVNLKDSVRSTEEILKSSQSNTRALHYGMKWNGEEMRNSFQHKKLPVVDIPSESESDDDNNEEIPPLPPKHSIFMGSVFEKSDKKIQPNTVTESNTPRSPSDAYNMFCRGDDLGKTLSLYEKKKLARRSQRHQLKA